jgi:Recombination endonuclease VII
MPDLAVDGTPLWGDPPYSTTMDRDLRRLYGMRLDHYEALLADQDGRCAICAKPPATGKRLVVDENHETRMIRGLLCTRCNRLTTEARERYLADPPAARRQWYVPEKNWKVRQARNESRARRHQETKEATKREQAGPAGPPVAGVDRLRAMTRATDPDQAFRVGLEAAGVATSNPYDRALADTAEWSGGPVRVAPKPVPPREEAPPRRRGLLGRLFG